VTPEQEKIIADSVRAQVEAEEAKQAYIFLSRHPEFPQSQANASMMQSLLAAKGWEFRCDNMEAIFGDPASRTKFAPNSSPVPTIEPAPEPILVEPVEETYGLTIESIQKMSGSELRDVLRNPRKSKVANKLIEKFAQENPGVNSHRFNTADLRGAL
jgi:hypothetical protein